MKISGEQNGLTTSQGKHLLCAILDVWCTQNWLIPGSGTSASLQRGRRGHKIINNLCLITIKMGPNRFRSCFSTVQFPIQESWITASLNLEFVPLLGGEGTSHSTIMIGQCSYLLNNICVMFSSQNLPLLKNLSSSWSSFPPSLAFESFALSLNNHYCPPCFQYPDQCCILLHVLAKHISPLPPLIHLGPRSPRSHLSSPLVVRASSSNILTVSIATVAP